MSPPRSVGERVFTGMRIAFGLLLGSPFLLILTPLWWVYRLTERVAGRPDPLPPWAVLFSPERIRAAEVQEMQRRMGLQRRMQGLVSGVDMAEPPHGTLSPGEKWVPGSAPVTARPPLPTPAGSVLVTGGARRVGAALCRHLAALGYPVAVGYLESAGAAQDVVRDIVSRGGRAQAWRLDLTQPQAAQEVFQEMQRLWDCPLEMLVNNASRFLPTGDDSRSWADMDLMARVNFTGPMVLSLLAARHMTPGRGLIINIADIWGERPLKGHAGYSASRAALLMGTRVLARDLAPGVRVNAIAPGALMPPDATVAGEETPFDILLRNTPLSHRAGVDNLFLAVHYLIGAPFVTGEVLRVDGGRALS
ncbi:MAG: SDR family NAD(P)-dependent oxidoreductase [Magnetococcus sp. WYHC-3]